MKFVAAFRWIALLATMVLAAGRVSAAAEMPSIERSAAVFIGRVELLGEKLPKSSDNWYPLWLAEVALESVEKTDAPTSGRVSVYYDLNLANMCPSPPRLHLGQRARYYCVRRPLPGLGTVLFVTDVEMVPHARDTFTLPNTTETPSASDPISVRLQNFGEIPRLGEFIPQVH